jgi:hypothetical protein
MSRLALSAVAAALAAVAFAACRPSPVGPPPVLVTTGETSGFLRTGRYEEVVRLCRDFARAYAKRGVECVVLGETTQARELVALHVPASGGANAPEILIQAGIHAGEIEGKDAGFWFLRDVLDGKVAAGVLDAAGVWFVPVFNPDGHERFGPNNRPNQRGPEEMGFRTTGVNLNLNRDYIKADAPEMRALLALMMKVDPVMLIDLHTTDGAKFEHDISVNVAPLTPSGGSLTAAAAALSQHVMERLAALGHLPLDFYPEFVVHDDPTTGFTIGEPPPRFSHAYASARDRLGILVETHSWHTYKQRALSTYHALQAIFERAATDAAAWRALELERDAEVVAKGLPTPTALLYDVDGHKREIEFRGYAYTTRPSELTGASWIEYDETKPEVWKVPLFDRLAPVLEVTPPAAGYVVDGGFATQIAALLDLHGIRYAWIDTQPALDVEVFRATKVSYEPTTEGRTRVTLAGAWAPERRTLDRHALFVPIAQPRARLALFLFEPRSPDSLVQWGEFNAVFERKEYLEGYVVEVVAREMLADPATKQAWDAALAADPALAASPEAKRLWFAKRHPSWDERKDLVPVFRVATPPVTPPAQ